LVNWFFWEHSWDNEIKEKEIQTNEITTIEL
jgi:hypothetical protein